MMNFNLVYIAVSVKSPSQNPEASLGGTCSCSLYSVSHFQYVCMYMCL